MANSVSKTHSSEDEVILRDRISQLPDTLLHHILSFLSTKEASAISLLSKRWNSVRLSQHTLDFDDKSFSCMRSFVKFVDSALNIFRDPSNPITIFRMKCSGNLFKRPNMKFEPWVEAMLKQGVQHLELCFPSWYAVNLPSSIFVCNTIRVLKLDGGRVGDIVSSVDLPSLKILHLENFYFPSFKCVSTILSRCSLQLEKLVLNGISAYEYDRIIDQIMLPHMTSSYNYNVLVELHSQLTSASTYEIPTFCNLTHLEISMVLPPSIILKWLQNCPKLQILVIDKVKDEGSTTTLVDVPESVLLSISPHLEEVYVGNFLGSESEFEFAKIIVKNAHGLKTFSMGMSNYARLSIFPKATERCRLLLQYPY